jgi:hypothetical protein
MAKSDNVDDGPEEPHYEVGYGRPPKATRFKPGQSGNPRGRPKGAKSIPALLEGELNRKIRVREGNRERMLTMRELLVRRLVANGVQKGGRDGDLLLRMLASHAADEGLASLPQALDAQDEAILRRFLETLQVANRSGEPEEPHPSGEPEASDDPDEAAPDADPNPGEEDPTT